MEDHCDHQLKALRRGVEERLDIFPQMANLFLFINKFMGVIIIKICGAISSLPAVILKANGTATLQAAAIKRIDVNASQ